MTQVTNEIETALQAVLLQSTDLATAITGWGVTKLFNTAADQRTGHPFVVFRDVTPPAEGGIRYNFGSRRVSSRYLYRVVGVVDELAGLDAGVIDNAIDDALHDADLSLGGTFEAMVCRRLANVNDATTVDGRSFRERGGLYEITVTE